MALQVVQLGIRHALAHKHYGRAMKLVTKQMEDKPCRDLDKRVVEVSDQLPLLQNPFAPLCPLFLDSFTSALAGGIVHVTLRTGFLSSTRSHSNPSDEASDVGNLCSSRVPLPG